MLISNLRVKEIKEDMSRTFRLKLDDRWTRTVTEWILDNVSTSSARLTDQQHDGVTPLDLGQN